MTYESIQFTIANGIAVLTLNRPDRLNSFTQAMHGEVRDALDRLQADKTVRVLVLTGAGRGFCAGQDLNDRAVEPAGRPGVDLGESVEKFYAPLVTTLRTLPMPVICAVNGVAAGAGANLGAGLRHRAGREVRQLHRSLLQAGPDPGHRRHLGAAAPDRPRARDGPGPAGRQAAGREGRAMGPDLARVADEDLMNEAMAMAEHFAQRQPRAWRTPRKPCWPAGPTRWTNNCSWKPA